MNKFETIILSFIFLIVFSYSSFGQGMPPDDTEVPIDGGITLLITSAAVWGIKKIRSNKE
ncbi:MAG: hypothetical protein K2Q22_13350 [Cytophagales bacterium]|nr:hypothetical protein [Cytophagales bacterium]